MTYVALSKLDKILAKFALKISLDEKLTSAGCFVFNENFPVRKASNKISFMRPKKQTLLVGRLEIRVNRDQLPICS